MAILCAKFICVILFKQCGLNHEKNVYAALSYSKAIQHNAVFQYMISNKG